MWIRVNRSRNLGEAIEQVRRETGLTPAELAERLDVTRTTVIDMEKGRAERMWRSPTRRMRADGPEHPRTPGAPR